MKKRIISIITFLAIFISNISFVTFATQQKIYVDGVELKGKVSKNFEIGYAGIAIPYSAVARELGYTVSYNEETKTITSIKGQKSLSFQIGGVKASVNDGDKKSYYALGVPPIEEGGATYVSHSDICEFFNLAMYNEKEKEQLEFYSIDLYKSMLSENCKNLISLLKGLEIPKEFSLDQTIKANGVVNSDMFGLKLNGETSVKSSFEKKNDKMKLSFSVDNKGLGNFYDLFVSQPFSTGFDNFDDLVDLDKPIALDCYMDSEFLYVKSDVLLLNYLYNAYNYPILSIKKAYELSRDKWIEIPLDTKIIEAVSEYTSFLKEPQKTDDELLDAIIENVMVTARNFGDEATITKTFKIITELFNDKNLSVVKDENKEEIKLSVTADLLKTVAKKYFEIDDKDLTNILNFLNFNVDFIVTKVENEVNNTNDVKVFLSNIPNKYGINCGTIELNAKIEGKLNQNIVDVIKPEIKEQIKGNEIETIIKNPIIDIE